MPIQLSTTNLVAQHQGVKVCVFSEAGVGKTRLCATAPGPIILSAEAGLLSLSQYEIPTIKVESLEHLDEIYQWLSRSAEAAQYATVCLDSITEIADVVLTRKKKQLKDGRAAYGEMNDEMSERVRMFRDLPGKHVYFSAQQEHVDVGNGIHKFGPAMPGRSMTQKLPYYFDELFCMKVGQDTDGNSFRYLQTQPDIQTMGKDRSGLLAPTEAPDLNYIFNKILGVQQ